MSTLHLSSVAIFGIGPHVILYGAFGTYQVLRAVWTIRKKSYADALEHAVHGIVYLLLAAV